MKREWIVACVILAAGFLSAPGCAGARPSASARPAPRTQEADIAEIVAVLVKAQLRRRGEAPLGKYLVFVVDGRATFCGGCNETIYKEEQQAVEKDLPQELVGLFHKLATQNTSSEPLPVTAIPLAKLESKARLEELFKDRGGWGRFYDAYPGSRGYMAISSLAYSDNRVEALVVVSHYCGRLCGTGDLVHLKHDGKRWTIAGRYFLWIS